MTTAIAAALIAAGVPPNSSASSKPKQGVEKKTLDISHQPRRKPDRGHWGQSDRAAILEWSHPDLGKIFVELKSFKFSGDVHQEGPNTWCRVDLGPHKPRFIEIDFNYDLPEGVQLLHGRGSRLIDVEKDDPIPFEIAVEWQQFDPTKPDSPAVPHFPLGYMQDFQLFLINKKKGLVVHIDVAIVSREGTFWVTVQEVMGAECVAHPWDTDIPGYTSLLVKGHNLTLIPAFADNSYPGFDPVASIERSYKGRAEQLLTFIENFGAFVQYEQCSPGSWEPQWPTEIPAELKSKGYNTTAVVLWYNLTLGWGFLLLKNRQSCYVHFKTILEGNGKRVTENGGFPVLRSGQGVFVKYTHNPGKDNPAATAVRLA